MENDNKVKLAKLKVLQLYSRIKSGDATSALLDIVNELLDTINSIPKGPKGDKGDKGEIGPRGFDGKNGVDGRNGKDGKDGRDGRDGRDGQDGIDGQDGKDGKDFTPIDIEELVVNTVNYLETLEGDDRLDASAIKNLPQFTQNIINEVGHGFTETQIKAGTNITVGKDAFGNWVISSTGGGGGHTIQDEGTPLTQRTNLNFVGAGVTVTDDAGNNATVVTISTSAGAGYQTATGTVDGSNTIFTFAVAPNAIMVDNVILRKTSSDSTVNWTGTTTITLSVAPNFDIAGIA